MDASSRAHVVIDTNVLFEGLSQKNGACGLIIDAWLAGLIHVHVTDALAYEYIDVLTRKFSAEKQAHMRTALATLLNLATFTTVFYSWRPASPDPGDDLVIDCAMNANALVVTANVKDFRRAQSYLGLPVMTPTEFITWLAAQ